MTAQILETQALSDQELEAVNGGMNPILGGLLYAVGDFATFKTLSRVDRGSDYSLLKAAAGS